MTCEKCKHWCGAGVPVMGRCLRYPPVWADGKWGWPETRRYNTCGEFKEVISYITVEQLARIKADAASRRQALSD
jgi:hypothetical protein